MITGVWVTCTLHLQMGVCDATALTALHIIALSHPKPLTPVLKFAV